MVAIAQEKCQKYPTTAEVLEELKSTTNIGFPILAMSLASYVRNMVMVACMGRLGSLELAGGALAIGFTNITGYSLLSGLAMGMDPLCAQAFGSRNRALAVLTLHRTIALLLVASVPVALLWLNIEPLMLVLNQDPAVTRVAALYCRFALPDLLANSFLHPIRIFLRTRGTTWPLMWSNLLAMVFHVPLAVLLTFELSLGVRGIAISACLTNFATLFCLLLYLRYDNGGDDSPLETPFFPARSRVWESWGVLVRLSVQSCLGVCLEWWWYEFMTILAGYLPNPRAALGAAAIVIQTTSLLYTLPASLSASASTRVGNELGAGRPRRARLAAGLVVGLAVAASVLGFAWTTLGKESWGRVFTRDREVLELTAAVLPVIGLCELANCPQTAACGILRGSARPGPAAAINFYAFYLVGAPVAVALGFVWRLGFVGLCYGLLAAQIACVASILAVVHRTDWERESIKAQDFVARDVRVLAHDDHEKLVIQCEQGFTVENNTSSNNT